jgi:acyl carrier protein phosphodiesterase
LLKRNSGFNQTGTAEYFIFNNMNYLAHAYLSFNRADILAGNMINDYVKGKKKFDYPESIQKGMLLHRAIDDFTDHHPATELAKQFFKADYRLYAGAFVDVLYDHFLANDINEFGYDVDLESFCESTYGSLQNNVELFPQKFQQVLPYMQSQNWLYNYRYREGIEKSFQGLVRRAAYLSESATAFAIFNNQYDALQTCYNDFFPALKQFSLYQLNLLDNR